MGVLRRQGRDGTGDTMRVLANYNLTALEGVGAAQQQHMHQRYAVYLPTLPLKLKTKMMAVQKMNVNKLNVMIAERRSLLVLRTRRRTKFRMHTRSFHFASKHQPQGRDGAFRRIAISVSFP